MARESWVLMTNLHLNRKPVSLFLKKPLITQEINLRKIFKDELQLFTLLISTHYMEGLFLEEIKVKRLVLVLIECKFSKNKEINNK